MRIYGIRLFNLDGWHNGAALYPVLKAITKDIHDHGFLATMITDSLSYCGFLMAITGKASNFLLKLLTLLTRLAMKIFRSGSIFIS